ncbi:putative protein TPRXL [Mytilus californianus]|uniref:putative protein TPRXL n=1 Tax=Mytilus californianus TaxID=6549 RepID=UPI00224723CE|nr:putative protein TPRXL [Mytilus californianus]
MPTLEDITKDARNSIALEDIKERLQNLKKYYERLRLEKQSNTNEIQAESNTIIEHVKSTRLKLNQYLDCLEKEVLQKEKNEKKKTNILATTAPPKSVSSTSSVKSAKYLASEEVMKQVMSFTSSSEEMSPGNSPPKQSLSSHIQPTPSSYPVSSHSTSHNQSTPSDIQPAILLKTHCQSAISPESVLSTEANCDILSLSPPPSVLSTQPTSSQQSPHSSVQAVLSPPPSVPSTQPTSTQQSPYSSVRAVLSPPPSVLSTQPASTQQSQHSSVQAVSQSSFQSATPCNYVSTKSTHSALYNQPSIQPDIQQPLTNSISDIQSTFHSQSTTFHSPGSTQSPTFSTQQIFVAEPFVPMVSSASENSTPLSMSSARQGTSFTDDPTDSSDILSNSNFQHIISSPESARLLQSIMKDNINTTPSCQMVHHCSYLDRIEKTMNEVLRVLISIQSLNPVQIQVVDVVTSNTDSIHQVIP